MKLSCYLSCLFINLKRNSLPHILAAAALTASVPLVFCLTSLTEPLAAQPLEMYLSLTGTLLLTPIFLPEQNAEIRDTVRMRKMSYLSVCALRLVYLCIILAVLYAVITAALVIGESRITPEHFWGGISTALFLGAAGVLGAALGGNTIIGYMASMLYYVVNFSLKTRLGVFFLFGLSCETGVSKLWLLGSAAAMIAAAFGCLKYIRRID